MIHSPAWSNWIWYPNQPSVRKYIIHFTSKFLSRFWTNSKIYTFFFGAISPPWAKASSFTKFLDHTQRRTTFGRTPLDEWSVSRRDLYLTTHNAHYRQTSMPPVGFEPTISAVERPQTYALDRAATGTGIRKILTFKNNIWFQIHHVLFLKLNSLYTCIGSKTSVVLRCVCAF